MAFCIEHINVRQGKIDFEVSCSASCLYVDKELAARMLEAFPNLQNHVCVNKKGDTFGADIIGTELPHLFEHLTIELLAQKFPTEASRGLFSGYTTWLQKPFGSNKVSSFGAFAKILPKKFLRKKEARRARAYMLVTLSYIKEQDCIDAAKKSEELINNFLGEHHIGK